MPLDGGVALDRDGHGLAGLPGGERERGQRHRGVVARRGGRGPTLVVATLILAVRPGVGAVDSDTVNVIAVVPLLPSLRPRH